MTEVRFYHLQSKRLEDALPEILDKAYERGMRAVVIASSDERVESLNTKLWTYNPNAFLPHGSVKDGNAAEQPIWLTSNDNDFPNNPDLLVLTDGAQSAHLAQFKLCCDIFDGNDPSAVDAARTRWQNYKTQDFPVTYWKQDEQ